MRLVRLWVMVASVMVPLAAAGAALALPAAPVDAFESSDGCGCHAAFLDQWRKTMHSKAVDDPLYQYKLAKGNEQTDGAIGPFCETCHSPAAAMFGELGQDEYSPVAMEGVSCDVCHQVTGHTEPIGNTSLVWTPDGTKRAQFDDAFSPAHATEYSAVHESAEFCGSCHDVIHPGNGLMLEGTYSEWKSGPYAAEGIVCQDCHMTPGPGVTKPNPGKAAAGGPDREHIYTMTFAGANVGLGDAVLAEERLQAAAEISLTAPETLDPGSSAPVTVRITNVGAGHYLPTGLTDVRRMWLELVATGPDGTETEIGRREFHTVFHDAEGNSPAEIWFAEGVESDDRIPPRESVEQSWDVTMPDGPLTLTATLYYRSATEEMAEAAGVEIPTTTMTQAESAVYTSAEEAAEAALAESSSQSSEDGGNTMLLVMMVAGIAFIGAVAGFFIVKSRQG